MGVIRAGARALPERANLEHLRNEAKSLLRVIVRREPAATLAVAQLRVAREYGFPSWRALKSYVDAANDVGERLIQAVRAGDLTTVGAVLDRHPELVNCTTDRHGRVLPSDTRAMRLIHLAVAENQLEAARLLIERGAGLNVRNADGRSPLHDCFELGRDGFLDLLMAGGAEPDVTAAAAWGMLDRLHKILRHNPSLANDLITGTSPLGWTAYGDHPDAARLLFAHGAVVDWTAWDAAAFVANIRIARLFLSNGADPNHRNANNETPLHAVLRSRLVPDPTAFVRLLLAHNADPQTPDTTGQIPLDVASEQAAHTAETYYPIRPTQPKRLDTVIELLTPEGPPREPPARAR